MGLKVQSKARIEIQLCLSSKGQKNINTVISLWGKNNLCEEMTGIITTLSVIVPKSRARSITKSENRAYAGQIERSKIGGRLP